MSVVGSTYTDAAGNFSFDRVPVGEIKLLAARQATHEQAWAQSVLAAGEERSLTLILPGSGRIVRGEVRDALNQLVAGAKVAGGPALTTTDANGHFELKGFPLGKVTLTAQAPGSQALGRADVNIASPNGVVDVVITSRRLERCGAGCWRRTARPRSDCRGSSCGSETAA